MLGYLGSLFWFDFGRNSKKSYDIQHSHGMLDMEVRISFSKDAMAGTRFILSLLLKNWTNYETMVFRTYAKIHTGQ